jgi:[pyruvate, water dikinase]-phosphate phosphotransferase / [pyruvate, water dikinase] kinase
MARRTLFLVSDRTGITVQTLAQALLSQFPAFDVVRVSAPFIADEQAARALVEQIGAAAAHDGAPPIVLSSLADDHLRAILKTSGALCLDFLETFIAPLEQALGTASLHHAGHSHGDPASAAYERRMDAVNFTLAHDDGMTTAQLDQAEIILIGVSRAGKTPTSLYLGLQFGIRVANFPLTEEELAVPALPDSLVPFRSKLFGLTIEPLRMHHIRQARRPGSRYASREQCEFEVRQALRLFRELGIPHLDTTTRSIEEIATTIMQMAGLSRPVY